MVLDSKALEEWSDEDCRDGIRQTGVELVLIPWEDYFQDRLGFYEIVILSHPSTFRKTYSKLREYHRTSFFVLIYDCEALWYRQDEGVALLYENDGIEFPSLQRDRIDSTSRQLITNRSKDDEIKLLGLADIILSAAENEKKIISDMIPGAHVHTTHT